MKGLRATPFRRRRIEKWAVVALLILCLYSIQRTELTSHLDVNGRRSTTLGSNESHMTQLNHLVIVPALDHVPINRSAIHRNETPPVPHPHAGARDALGEWGYVADVQAVKRLVEEQYRVSRGIPSGQEVVVPRSFLTYHGEEQLDVACNIGPRNGFERPSGWDILNKTVQVGGPDPPADPNVTLPYLAGRVDDRIPTTRNPRILCALYTYEKRHDMVTAVAETWGWKCDGLFAASTETVEYPSELGFGAIDLPHLGVEEYSNMWQKTRSILSYMHDHYRDDFDFFFLSGDDTYLIVENLKKTLQWMGDASWEWPLFLGQFFPSDKGGMFCGGGSGYLLNRKALEVLVKDSFPFCEAETRSATEDILVSFCLRQVGIDMNHSVDAIGAQRFHGNNPFEVCTLAPKRNVTSFWSDAYNLWGSLYGYKTGCDLISAQSVSFHHARSVLEMKRYHSILYKRSCPSGSHLGDLFENFEER